MQSVSPGVTHPEPVQGTKRSNPFEFGEPEDLRSALDEAALSRSDRDLATTQNKLCGLIDDNGGFTRLLENLTQAQIYQKRMRRNNSKEYKDTDNLPFNMCSSEDMFSSSPEDKSPKRNSPNIAEGGFKKYLRDRYLSDREGGDNMKGEDAFTKFREPLNSESDEPSPLPPVFTFTPPSAAPRFIASVRSTSSSSYVTPDQDSEPGQSPFSLSPSPHSPHLAYSLMPSFPFTPSPSHQQQFAAAVSRQCQSAPQTPQSSPRFPLLTIPPCFVFPPDLSLMQQKASTPPQGMVTGDRAYPCNVCGRVFGRSDMLSRHARLHSGLKPYECQVCGQAFSRSDHLNTHLRTHTGQKPYSCPMCSYAACRRDMITRHMKIHRRQRHAPSLT